MLIYSFFNQGRVLKVIRRGPGTITISAVYGVKLFTSLAYLGHNIDWCEELNKVDQFGYKDYNKVE